MSKVDKILGRRSQEWRLPPYTRRPDYFTVTDGSRQVGGNPSNYIYSLMCDDTTHIQRLLGSNVVLGDQLPAVQSKPSLTGISVPQKPLYIFFDCETTGLSPLTTDIIEMGAVVVHSNGRQHTFSKLVQTDQWITGSAYDVHGIGSDDIENEVEFPEAFEALCKWITKQTKLAGAEEGTKYYPVLVAHNGYAFDYRVLLSNMARYEVDMSWFEKHSVKFADSLHYLRKMRREGHELLDADCKLSLGRLYMNFFPHEDYEEHRALPDSENLKKLFTESALKSLLPSMPAKSFDEQFKDYEMAGDKRELQVMYQITPQQATRLVECRLSTKALRDLYEIAKTDGEFDATIHKMGVNSKPLREKLLLCLGNSI